MTREDERIDTRKIDVAPLVSRSASRYLSATSRRFPRQHRGDPSVRII